MTPKQLAQRLRVIDYEIRTQLDLEAGYRRLSQAAKEKAERLRRERSALQEPETP